MRISLVEKDEAPDVVRRIYEGGVRRLRERLEVQIFTDTFKEPAVLRGFDALVATREYLNGREVPRSTADYEPPSGV